jgi:hypothetical protein
MGVPVMPPARRPRPQDGGLEDYVDVAERIVAFTERYPDGSLQTRTWDVREIGGRLFIVYQALAYRQPDDQRPGMGTAWEPFPGPTPFTRDSELMNAETAAWGRAIVAVGITASRKIASTQEVRARATPAVQEAPPAPVPDPPQEAVPVVHINPITEKQADAIRSLLQVSMQRGMTSTILRAALDGMNLQSVPLTAGWVDSLSSEKASELISFLQAGVEPPVHDPAGEV